MLIKICTKNEPLVNCDVLIAKESVTLQVPVAELKSALDVNPEIHLVKDRENMMVKCGILVAGILAATSPEKCGKAVFVACSDDPILNAICSLEYALSDGSPAKCVPSAPKGAKTQPAPRSRGKSKPAQKAGAEAGTKPAPEKKDGAGTPAQPGKDGEAGDAPKLPEGLSMDNVGKPIPGDGADPMSDPALVTADGEMNLEGGAPGDRKAAPGEAPAARIIKMLKDAGIPSGQVPGCLDAIRESIDPDVTLPMQVKMRLAKDSADHFLDPAETASRIAPIYSDVKKLMEEARNT